MFLKVYRIQACFTCILLLVRLHLLVSSAEALSAVVVSATLDSALENYCYIVRRFESEETPKRDGRKVRTLSLRCCTRNTCIACSSLKQLNQQLHEVDVPPVSLQATSMAMSPSRAAVWPIARLSPSRAKYAGSASSQLTMSLGWD